jgi:hypothetical protein
LFCIVLSIFGQDIDQLDNIIGIGACRGNKQPG